MLEQAESTGSRVGSPGSLTLDLYQTSDDGRHIGLVNRRFVKRAGNLVARSPLPPLLQSCDGRTRD